MYPIGISNILKQRYLHDEKWVTQILTEPEETIHFPLFDMTLTLGDIYEDIVFADSQSDSRKHP